MQKPSGLGIKMVLGGIVASVVIFAIATGIHLSMVSREIMLVVTLFVPIVVGAMLIYQDRSQRRSEDSAWHYIEKSDHYL